MLSAGTSARALLLEAVHLAAEARELLHVHVGRRTADLERMGISGDELYHEVVPSDDTLRAVEGRLLADARRTRPALRTSFTAYCAYQAS